MKEIIEWHKYPETKPKKDGYCLVHFKNVGYPVPDLEPMLWRGDRFWWLRDGGYDDDGEDTIAWAEMPKGYIDKGATGN